MVSGFTCSRMLSDRSLSSSPPQSFFSGQISRLPRTLTPVLGIWKRGSSCIFLLFLQSLPRYYYGIHCCCSCQNFWRKAAETYSGEPQPQESQKGSVQHCRSLKSQKTVSLDSVWTKNHCLRSRKLLPSRRLCGRFIQNQEVFPRHGSALDHYWTYIRGEHLYCFSAHKMFCDYIEN